MSDGNNQNNQPKKLIDIKTPFLIFLTVNFIGSNMQTEDTDKGL